jgi:hypothetical protein
MLPIFGNKLPITTLDRHSARPGLTTAYACTRAPDPFPRPCPRETPPRGESCPASARYATSDFCGKMGKVSGVVMIKRLSNCTHGILARLNARSRLVVIATTFSLSVSTMAGGNASAQECKPLNYLGAISIAITSNSGIEAATLLNDVPTSMVLLGGESSYLTHDTVAKLGLHELPSRVKTYFSDGEVSDTYVNVPKFSVGPVGGGMLFQVYGRAPDGRDRLSLNTFALYDIDLDFFSGRLNLFSSDHCEGKAAYFSTSAITAIPYEGDNLEIPIVLDGQATKAYLLNGGAETIMSLAEATKLFGLTAASPGMEPFHQGVTEGYRYRFSTLSFGGVTVRNTVVAIFPGKLKNMFKEKPTGSLITAGPFEALPIRMGIGLNLLRQLHIYVAKKERKLYIAPGDGAAAKLLPPLKTGP